MNAFPSVRGPRRELIGIPGSPPDLARPPSGCRFHPRCPEVMPSCLSREPELYRVGDADVRCLLYAEQAKEAVLSRGGGARLARDTASRRTPTSRCSARST